MTIQQVLHEFGVNGAQGEGRPSARSLGSPNRRILISLGIAALALAGCGSQPDPEAEETARTAYQHLIRGEDEALEAMVDPQVRNPRNMAAYADMRARIPPGGWLEVRTVGWRSLPGTHGRVVTLRQAYDYGRQTVTVSAELVPNDESGWMLRVFNVETSRSKES